MLNSIMTICFTLILMCFPFYNSKNILNLLDLEHEVIKNNLKLLLQEACLEVPRKCHSTDQ